MNHARRGGITLLCALCAALALAPGRSSAGEMDLTLSRLVLDPACATFANVPGMNAPWTCGQMIDQDGFRFLASQLGAVFAPKLMAPAETLGYNGFYVGVELSMTNIDRNYNSPAPMSGCGRDGNAMCPTQASVWQRATLGKPTDTSGVNSNPDPYMFVTTVHARKGFPFGFELGTQVGVYTWNSNLVAYGADIRWAPFEGFYHGVGYLPDLAVRGSLNRLTGSNELDLTIIGFDVSLSKDVGVAGQFSLTPYAGFQHLWIVADSEVVDPSPGRDAWNECNPYWNPRAYCILPDMRAATFPPGSTMAQQDAICSSMTGTWTADWTCSQDPADFNNQMVFRREWINRNRAFVGIRFLWEHLAITGEVMFDVTQPMAGSIEVPGRQFTASLGVGLDY